MLKIVPFTFYCASSLNDGDYENISLVNKRQKLQCVKYGKTIEIQSVKVLHLAVCQSGI